MSPRDGRNLNFAAPFLREAAEKRGWKVVLHPDGGFAGQIRLPDGAFRYFVRSTFDLNSAASAAVARDKALTKFFLGRAGFPVIAGRTFFSERLCRSVGSTRNAAAARRYAARAGYPVIVKPNSGFAGEGVTRVERAADLAEALSHAFAGDDVVLVERYVSGLPEYRLVLVDGELLLAYERRPFAVTGDGRSTLRTLVSRAERRASSRGVGHPGRERLESQLAATGAAWTDVLPSGETLRLVDAANLSQGGSAVEVTAVHPSIIDLAANAARLLGLRYCGIDLFAEDIGGGRGARHLIELNASPTIHQFSALSGARRARLLRFHDRLLAAMERTA